MSDQTPKTASDQPKETWGRLGFKEVVGTALGAVSVGILGGSISLYRKGSMIQALQVGVGGAAFGALVIAGTGSDIYDETIGRFTAKPSFTDKLDQERQQQNQPSRS